MSIENYFETFSRDRIDRLFGSKSGSGSNISTGSNSSSNSNNDPNNNILPYLVCGLN